MNGRCLAGWSSIALARGRLLDWLELSDPRCESFVRERHEILPRIISVGTSKGGDAIELLCRRGCILLSQRPQHYLQKQDVFDDFHNPVNPRWLLAISRMILPKILPRPAENWRANVAQRTKPSQSLSLSSPPPSKLSSIPQSLLPILRRPLSS